MYTISLIVEDVGHKNFLTALIGKLAKQAGIEIRKKLVNIRGGHGKVVFKVEQYMNDLQHGRKPLPDLILIATDSNCKGLLRCQQELEKKIPQQLRNFVVYAIPDPHIERWMMLDSRAFKKVFGKGCNAPDQKCHKDRYKYLLMETIKHAVPHVHPTLGGMEYADEIVSHMDFKHIKDKSLSQVIQELNRIFKQWSQQ